MIVADANLLAYLVMPGERTEEAAAVLALGVSLITTDRAVLKAFPKRAMTPAEFLSE